MSDFFYVQPHNDFTEDFKVRYKMKTLFFFLCAQHVESEPASLYAARQFFSCVCICTNPTYPRSLFSCIVAFPTGIPTIHHVTIHHVATRHVASRYHVMYARLTRCCSDLIVLQLHRSRSLIRRAAVSSHWEAGRRPVFLSDLGRTVEEEAAVLNSQTKEASALLHRLPIVQSKYLHTSSLYEALLCSVCIYTRAPAPPPT